VSRNAGLLLAKRKKKKNKKEDKSAVRFGQSKGKGYGGKKKRHRLGQDHLAGHWQKKQQISRRKKKKRKKKEENAGHITGAFKPPRGWEGIPFPTVPRGENPERKKKGSCNWYYRCGLIHTKTLRKEKRRKPGGG